MGIKDVLKKVFLLATLFSLPGIALSQTAYFIDGYHGGVYGHYPDWQTQFMVDMLEDNPEWKINLEIEPETWDSVRVNDSIAYQNFKNALTDPEIENRVEFVNPSYAQSYLYNISGESVIRQFTYGIEHTLKHFPSATFTTYSSEEPCFTSALPQILKSLGFKYAVLKNPNTCWGGYCRAHGGELINWIGPDGTSIVTVPRYSSEGLEPGSTWQTEAWDNSEEYISGAFEQGIKNPVGMTLQDAAWDGGPWLENTIRDYYKPSIYKTWTDYIENSSIGSTDEDWNFSQEDILVSIMWGSQVLQRIAQQVRVSENNIVAAEKLASFASIYNKKTWPEADLDEAWRTLLLAQHHDTWIVPYNGPPNNTWADKVRRWTNSTNSISNDVIAQSTGESFENSENNDTKLLRIYNTAGSTRTDIVEYEIPDSFSTNRIRVANGKGETVPHQTSQLNSDSAQIVFPAVVPGMGYTTYEIKKSQPDDNKEKYTGARAIQQDDGTIQLESDFYKILINPEEGGVIESLVSKKLNDREFVDQTHQRSFNEIRGHFIEDGKFHSSTDNPASVKIIEDGPVRATVEIEGTISGHPFTQTISLIQGQRRIDFNVNLDWQGNPRIGEFSQMGNYEDENKRKGFYNDKYKLHLVFPINLQSQKVFKNAPFDVTESKLSNTFFNRWDEIKHNIILNWVDVTDGESEHGLTLLSDHTTSYLHGSDYPLGLTLQYSDIGLWGRNYRIDGPSEVSYSLIPHKGKWDEAGIWSEDTNWNEPLILTEVNSESSIESDMEKSFVDLGDTGYELVNMLADGNNIEVRLFNAEANQTTKDISFNTKFEKAEILELDGRITRELNTTKKNNSTSISIQMPRFGIRTIKLTNVQPSE